MTTDVIPLGTAAAIPTPRRHLSAMAVQRKGRVLLFDCGEGTQYRFLDADLNRARIDAMFITHLHGDHVFGLPGLLSTMDLLQRTDPVTVVGPAGIRALVTSLPGLHPDAVGFPMTYRELAPGTEQAVVYETEEITVEARPLEHRTEAFGYRLQEKTRPGRFDPTAARNLGITNPRDFGRLQDGQAVETEDGTTVQPEQVLGPPREGTVVAYVTDSRPCDAGRTLADEADLLYHDATFTDALHARAVETGHATAREAAEIARDAGASRLLLGHVSARYDDPAPLVREARTVFPHADVAEELRRYVLDPREKW